MDRSDSESDHANHEFPPVGSSLSDSPDALGLCEGMLPRDLPKRSTFYDPVAERQLGLTDAKLFYQMSLSENHSKSGSLTWQHPHSLSAVESQGEMASSLELPQPALDVPEPGYAPTKLDLAGCSFTKDKLSNSRGMDVRNPPLPNCAPQLTPGTFTIAESTREKDFRLEQLAQTDRSLETAVPPPDNNIQQGSASISEIPDVDHHMLSELSTISSNIHKLIALRNKYIHLSLQGPSDNPKDSLDWVVYPPPPEPAWIQEPDTTLGSAPGSLSNSMVLASESGHPDPVKGGPNKAGKSKPSRRRKPGHDVGEDFDLDDIFPLPGPCDLAFRLDDNGVYQVWDPSERGHPRPLVQVPTIREFYMDLDEILNISADGPSKSFAFRRLQYLEGQFSMYVLLNEYQETADSKRVPHRDFYNVRKVDTHVHHSACMNQKHLLRFIKSKMKKCPDEVVLFRDGRHLTLAEVFDSINLTAYDLSIDTLDMHAHKDSFHRFDKFNLKYNPIGESRLRTIFLKTDNFINGRYLAEITKEVISDLESSKYQMVEWRISVYGKAIDEWDKLAAWVVDNKLFSHNVRWLIQIPRLFDVYKATGLMESFEQTITNLFQPLFEVTKDPTTHPKLHVFLQRVIGFDSVDDESKIERRLFKKFPVPKSWDYNQNPPYSYWIYYLYANMVSLNHWRKRRGFNTFVLRPHCGEAGDSEHLAVAALCCHSISHGLLLRKVPLLQYIFYLEQIGIAMSPLSNNALFLTYERNPFNQYFKRGLNVSLSTDDPLQFAFTKEPLIEEYAVAAQIYKLSSVDMCELAKNSVKQSGYEDSIKQQWLGPDYLKQGPDGNKMDKTNVPDRRERFRHRILLEEKELLRRHIAGGKYDDLPESSFPAVFASPMETNAAAPPHKSLLISEKNKAAGGGTTVSPVGIGSQAPGVDSPHSPQPQQVIDPSRSSDRLSGSEPKIFPGVVSRRQRSNSSRLGEDSNYSHT